MYQGLFAAGGSSELSGVEARRGRERLQNADGRRREREIERVRLT